MSRTQGVPPVDRYGYSFGSACAARCHVTGYIVELRLEVREVDL